MHCQRWCQFFFAWRGCGSNIIAINYLKNVPMSCSILPAVPVDDKKFSFSSGTLFICIQLSSVICFFLPNAICSFLTTIRHCWHSRKKYRHPCQFPVQCLKQYLNNFHSCSFIHSLFFRKSEAWTKNGLCQEVEFGQASLSLLCQVLSS